MLYLVILVHEWCVGASLTCMFFSRSIQVPSLSGNIFLSCYFSPWVLCWSITDLYGFFQGIYKCHLYLATSASCVMSCIYFPLDVLSEWCITCECRCTDANSACVLVTNLFSLSFIGVPRPKKFEEARSPSQRLALYVIELVMQNLLGILM